ncbi:hypothetical protein SESBI_39280 [Sesbania bispinosa]|nr:hypothetical protein SESBI_39280 [Sesbania bispinosa]
MTNIPESIVNPPQTLEQRMEKLEGNFGQILDLLKTLIPNRDTTNGNSNNDNDNDASGGGPSIQANGENPSKVVIVTETSDPHGKVEDAIREGKLNGLTVSQDKLRKPGFQKKRRSSSGSSTPPQVNNISFPNNPPFTQNQVDQPRKERIKIDPVPISYSEIYDALLKENLVAPEVPQTVSNPPPKWYNSTETCKYHMGAPGHTIEKCWTFKHRVQRLRDTGKLNFQEGTKQSSGTTVEDNPLPNH